MFNYVPRVLVGKASGAISTAQTAGQTLNLPTVVAGDLYLVSEDLTVLDATSAAAASTVFIARGRGAGKILLSSPITRKLIRKNGFTFQAYAAPVAQVTTFAGLASLLTAGKEFKITVVIKDDLRLISNRQNRIVVNVTVKTGEAGTAALARLAANFNVQRASLSLITASVSGNDLVLTSKPVPTESINDYEFVSFEASAIEVTPGIISPVAILPSSETKAQGGQGLAVQVRQDERQAYGGLGITDLINFDRPVPSFAAVDGVGYDVWHILHRVESQGALQQIMSSPVRSTVYVVTGSAQKAAFEALIEAFVAGLATGAPDGE